MNTCALTYFWQSFHLKCYYYTSILVLYCYCFASNGYQKGFNYLFNVSVILLQMTWDKQSPFILYRFYNNQQYNITLTKKYYPFCAKDTGVLLISISNGRFSWLLASILFADLISFSGCEVSFVAV